MAAFAWSPSALAEEARLLQIASDGFAGSSVNVIAGLQNSLVTDGGHQFAVFYSADSTLVLARRKLKEDRWDLKRTPFTGKVADAHNTAAIAVDGRGILHVAWDHHGDPLRYARGATPHSLELGPKRAMTGSRETKVTYPAFLRLPSGNLLFLYRDGVSGRGNLVLNSYDVASEQWRQVHGNLIDGEGKRSAYASITADAGGRLHLAWVWRETPDVATNHDLCYARSDDAGQTWTTSAGEPLEMPLSFDSAEYIARIPEGRSLMNPPAVAADENGAPYIANYWKPNGSEIPQYHLVHRTPEGWKVEQVTNRKTAFDLAGTSTKRPPISRSILVTRKNQETGAREVYLVFRDGERGDRIVAFSTPHLGRSAWTARELTETSVGAWEPSHDPSAWRDHGVLSMLIQRVEQRDGNDSVAAETPATPVSVLNWNCSPGQ